jgi:hypothetical protein
LRAVGERGLSVKSSRLSWNVKRSYFEVEGTMDVVEVVCGPK